MDRGPGNEGLLAPSLQGLGGLWLRLESPSAEVWGAPLHQCPPWKRAPVTREHQESSGPVAGGCGPFLSF